MLEYVVPTVIIVFPACVVYFPMLGSLKLSGCTGFSGVLNTVVRKVVLYVVVVDSDIGMCSVYVSDDFARMVIFLCQFVV